MMKNGVSKVKYEKICENMEKWSARFHYFYLYICCSCGFLPAVVRSLFVYFTTDAGSAAFKLTYPAWSVHMTANSTIFENIFPFRIEQLIFMLSSSRFLFDTTNLFGYLVACSIIYVSCYYVFYSTSCAMVLFIGSAYLLILLLRELREDLVQFQEDKSVKEKEKAKELKKKLVEFLALHWDVKK